MLIIIDVKVWTPTLLYGMSKPFGN